MSGIVRKIDELGRIVIPKELRKTLNIKNSDDIEINISENKLILEKYYRLNSLKEILNNYSFILEKYLSCDFIITDKEKVIITAKKIKEIFDNSEINNNILSMIENRKQLLENSKPIIKFNSVLSLNKNYYFHPIIINADTLGSIFLLSENLIIEKDITIVEIIIQLLKLRLET